MKALQKKIKKIWKRLSRAEQNLIKFFSIAVGVIFFLVVGVLKLYTDMQRELLQPEEYVQAIEQLKETGRDSLIDSLQLIAEVITEIDPEDIDAHKKLIEIYTESKEFHKILPHIKRIEPFNSNDLEFLTSAGKAFYASGQPKEAIKYLNDAFTLNPNDPDIAMELYLAEFKIGKVKESIKKLDTLLSKYPDNVKLITYLATVKAESDPSNSDAEKLFERAITVDPTYPAAWYQYGRMQMNQGNFASALEKLKKSVLLDPLNPKFNARLGMAYYYMRKDKDAEYSYRTALAINSQDYNTLYNLGELYLSWSDDGDKENDVRQNIQKALESYLACLEINGEHHFAHYKVGLILNGNAQYKEAIKHFEKILAAKPNYVPALLQTALAYERLERLDDAQRFYTLAYEEDPFNKIILQKYQQFTKKVKAES